MVTPQYGQPSGYPELSVHGEHYYRELKRKNVIRLVLTYLAPLVILSVYFYFQYQAMLAENRKTQLLTVAENQAKTLDLFLRERVINLSNLIDDPKLILPPSSESMKNLLQKLQSNSPAFVDIGFFNSSGIQTQYAGPFPKLEKQNYSQEEWFTSLRTRTENFIITDIYLGFRQKPHFTIAVSRIIDDHYAVLRSTLDPQKIYEYITSLESPAKITSFIVNQKGYFQLVTPESGKLLERSAIIPPQNPRLGVKRNRMNGRTIHYAYFWLKTSNWALLTQQSSQASGQLFPNLQINIIAFSAAIILLIFSIIIIRARKIVRQIKETDQTKAQLSDNLLHASKLAAVGELASGIAHEINNPLAIINEEVGLMKDMLTPEFGKKLTKEEITSQLDIIQQAVFRCRDITRKLLTFVRKTDFNLQPCEIHSLIDEVVEDFYERELTVSNIQIVRNYCTARPKIITDKNQLQQVFINLINNAIDAIPGTGKISITTFLENRYVKIQVNDTGKGMTQDQLEKIFMPFYTTKNVGKGTGLGLSISYGIIKSLDGEISVESTVGVGTSFIIKLPVEEILNP